MKRPVVSMAAPLALLGAISCSGVTGGKAPTADGGVPATPPLTCVNDATCGNTRACVGNVCVHRQTDIGTWAIEIDPPRGSGAQLTELPAVGVVSPELMASPEISLAVSFDNTDKPGVTVPTSAGVILSAPSSIPGRLARSFQANLGANGTAQVLVPSTLRGEDVLVTLLPISPSDLSNPPYALPFMIPADATALAVPLPPDPFAIRGLLVSSLGTPKPGYRARVFEKAPPVSGILDREILVSSIGNTNPEPGVVRVILPGGARSDLTLELVPENGAADPVVRMTGLSLTLQNTDLGVIALPNYAAPGAFQVFPVTVNGDDGTPVEAATVRAHTTLAGSGGAGGTNVVVTGAGGGAGGIVVGTGTAGTTGAAGTTGTAGRSGTGATTGAGQITTQFFRDALTDAGGVANLSLIPGSTVQQPYTLSVVSPAGAIWASQCISGAPVGYNGPAAPTVTTRAMTLVRRPKVAGQVVSDSGMPVASVVVTATSAAAPMPPCLPGPAITSTTTDAAGRYELWLDPANYKLEFVPPAGSPLPRLTVLTTAVRSDVPLNVRLPEPAVVEATVRRDGAPLPNATVRIFQPRCEQVDPCTAPPLLHAETQTDANGRFRAIIPKPGPIGTN